MKVHHSSIHNDALHAHFLPTAECDFSAVDIEGRTALHWTVTNPNPSALNALVQAYPPLLNERYIYEVTVHIC